MIFFGNLRIRYSGRGPNSDFSIRVWPPRATWRCAREVRDHPGCLQRRVIGSKQPAHERIAAPINGTKTTASVTSPRTIKPISARHTRRWRMEGRWCMMGLLSPLHMGIRRPLETGPAERKVRPAARRQRLRACSHQHAPRRARRCCVTLGAW